MLTRWTKELFDRRVPQIVAMYVAAVWGLVQFIDFLSQRYLLSPHLTDLALLAGVLLVPSVAVLAFNHGQPGRNQWRRLEKIGVPVNFLFAALILSASFWGKDLGAATTKVVVEDEDGNAIERQLPKASFRKRVALFNFDVPNADSGTSWLGYAIPRAMAMDLVPEQFIDLQVSELFRDRLREAGYPELIGIPFSLQREISEEKHRGHFVTGTAGIEGSDFTATVALYETANGRLVQERSFADPDLFALVDRITARLREDLEVPTLENAEAANLPVAELLTSSLEAFRSYVEGVNAVAVSDDWPRAVEYLGRAVTADSSFASAQYTLFTVYLMSNQAPRGQPHLQSAMDHLYRLPERVRFAVKSDYYFMRQDVDRAMAVLEMWAELYPEDIAAHTTLAQIQTVRDDKDGAIASLARIFELDPAQSQVLRQIGSLYEAKGEFDEALSYFSQYAERFPEDPDSFTSLGDLRRRLGEHQQALEQYERALLLDPSRVGIQLAIASIHRDLGELDRALKGYEDALADAGTAEERAAALGALAGYYELRGEMDRSIEHGERSLAEAATFQPPIMAVQQRLGSLDAYVKAGRPETALAMLAELSGQLSPPLDRLAAFGELNVYLELEDLEQAERAVEKADEAIAFLNYDFLRPATKAARGRILELRGDCGSAVDRFREQAELAPTAISVNTDIGRCLRKLGELEAAEASIRETLRLRPSDPEASHELALVLIDVGRADEAREHVERALVVWENADPAYEPAALARETLAQLRG